MNKKWNEILISIIYSNSKHAIYLTRSKTNLPKQIIKTKI